MLKHIYLILVATFVFGMIVGILLRYMNLTTDDVELFPPSEDAPLTISVHAYGGCESVGCPSYRIEENGTFTYIVRMQNSPDIRTTGKIETNERKALEDKVKKTDLDAVSATEFSGSCPIAFDGPAFNYTIAFDQKYYTLDSCTQELRGIELFNILNNYFSVFQNWDKNT